MERQVEKLKRVNQEAENLVHIRDMEVSKQRAIASAGVNMIYAMADMVGEETILIPYETLNRQQDRYVVKQTEEGMEFRKVMS